MNYGLPPNLAGRPIGLNYGYGIIATSAASVASENKSLAFPSVADTIPTKSNQEDHVAMATWGCRKARQVIDNMPKILGVECLLAARAIFLTQGALGAFELGAGSQAVYDALRENIPFREEDSYMPNQTRPALEIVRSGVILNAVERRIGALR